ncbi:MAG: hypothetical protein ACRCXE_03870 [Metamycoplasmataceae bacterium]
MTITFRSVYGQNEDQQEIKFVSNLEKSVENDMNILEFLEPSNNIQNRIEYNDEKIIIYAGPTTIHMEKDKKIKNNFVTEHGTVIIVSHLKDILVEENNISFKYSLMDNNDNLINDFHIDLIISE